MPEYLAPGVYVEEVPSAVKPIAGVGTSTAGFIGHVADSVKMPPQPGKFELDSEGKPKLGENGNPIPILYNVALEKEPRLITNWEQFKNGFGDFQEGNKILAHTVYGFFDNGGRRCWVSRLADGVEANAVKAALEKFKAIDEIALVAVPGATDKAVQEAILSHCEDEYLQDRFAILDGLPEPGSLTKTEVQAGVRNSSYGAVYFPWIQAFDPATQENIYVPPSGHVAGVYARVDATRGVHKAPANEVIRGAVGVQTLVSKADQAGLNPDGINVIRKFNGNITVWG